MFLKSINKALDFRNLLQSRVILYLLFFAAIIQNFVCATSGDMAFVVFFILVAFLVTFFSKNMVVVLCVALVVSNVFKYGVAPTINEGFRLAEEKEGFTSDVLDKSEDDLTLMKDSTSSSSSSSSTTTVIDKLKSDISAKSNDVDTPKPSPKSKEEPKAKSIKAPGADPQTQLEYKNLLELQLKLIDGISNIQPVLTEVAEKIEKMKKSMKAAN